MSLRASLVLSALVSLAACGDDPVTTADTRDTSEVFVPPDTVSETEVAAEVEVRPEVEVTPETEVAAEVEVAPETEVAAEVEVAPETEVAAEVVEEISETTDTSEVGPDSSGECDHNGFVSVAGDAIAFDTGDTWYLGQSTLEAPLDVLSLEIYAELGGATTPGVYPITDDNYDACGNCVLIQTGCDESLFNCTRNFLANAGTLEITSIGGVGDQFAGALTDLTFVEITYDDAFHSTPVVGGETWCVSRYEFATELQ